MIAKRKSVFIILAVIGLSFSLYFFMSKSWLLLVIGILFSLVAAYNTTCGK